MVEGDPYHQFQMMLKPLSRALRQENVEVALRLADRLFEIGGSASALQERKVHVLLRAMEGTTPSVRTEFTSKVLDRFGAQLRDETREQLAGRLERL